MGFRLDLFAVRFLGVLVTTVVVVAAAALFFHARHLQMRCVIVICYLGISVLRCPASGIEVLKNQYTQHIAQVIGWMIYRDLRSWYLTLFLRLIVW
jgi:hypothetical protein